MENNFVFKWIEDKHDEFDEKKLKQDLFYAVALDKNENYMGEAYSHLSYCEDCKDEAKKGFNKMLKKNRYEMDINIDEAEYKAVKQIVMKPESSPERDDFLNCDNCGCLIDVGVLHTFSQKIDHYLSKNLSIKNLSNDDCYRIHKILNEADYPDLVKKLKEKIILDNNYTLSGANTND